MVAKVSRGSCVVVALAPLALALVAACNGGTEHVKPPAEPAITISFPSTVVAPGVEKTECVLLNLGNPKPLHIGAIHNSLGEGSHHLIVYRVADTIERTTPYACQPFSDTLDASKGSPLMVTQKKDDLLQLPSGVAYSLAANQMVRLEMHYINPTAKELTISASSTVIPISDEDFHDEADFLFIGNPDIRVAAHATAVLGPTFFQLPEELAGVKFFAMTGHEHQFGTNVQVATTTDASDPGTMVYDVPDWKWNEPKTQTFDTPITVPANGGFNFTCSWNNTSDQSVRFGESASYEMCFFWAYYYPSQGAKVCFHSKRISSGGAALDLCCPDHPLCTLLNEELSKNP
jgi:hypothetical protein